MHTRQKNTRRQRSAKKNSDQKRIKTSTGTGLLRIYLHGIMLYIYVKWSGRRDSNSRPSGWQPDALPTELLPRAIKTIRLKTVRQCFFCISPLFLLGVVQNDS